MSKYYKADDAERMLEELAREPNYKHADEEWLEGVMLARDRIEGLPTIEVSEDAIGGEWLLNFFVEFPDDYTLTIGNLRAVINDAPSVIPQVPSEDAISREYLIKALDNLDWYDFDMFYKVVENAPSVIPQPKEGE